MLLKVWGPHTTESPVVPVKQRPHYHGFAKNLRVRQILVGHHLVGFWLNLPFLPGNLPSRHRLHSAW